MAEVYGYRVSRRGRTEVTAAQFDDLCERYPDAPVWCEGGIWFIRVN